MQATAGLLSVVVAIEPWLLSDWFVFLCGTEGMLSGGFATLAVGQRVLRQGILVPDLAMGSVCSFSDIPQ